MWGAAVAAGAATMKVKTISRCEGDFTKERKHDVQKVFRNYDPVLHPMERATEYVQALNATKLDKVRHLTRAMAHASSLLYNHEDVDKFSDRVLRKLLTRTATTLAGVRETIRVSS